MTTALARRVQKLTSILDVAKALTAERDLDKLLPLILQEAAKVVEADRCSLFLLDAERGELWSRVAQGAQKEIRFPVGSGIAGAVAQSGEAIHIQDAYADPRFNRGVDLSSGYHTTSILAVPMRGADGAVSGVLQALNKQDGQPFTAEDEELLTALGGQAAAAVENAVLHQDIQQLFEGFVSASVVAIESRDPTTAGHSGRVAALTVELAKTLERVETGPWARTTFTPRELDEIRYASLLHDFGKVGVREAVLVKAEKLYPHELELLKSRFELARKDRELQSLRRRLSEVRTRGELHLNDIEFEEGARLSRELSELDAAYAFVLECNRPTVLEQGGFERLTGLSELTFMDAREVTRPLLTERELSFLSIPRGSLSREERLEIESHVTHTYRFLSQIPWTRALRRVPEIAWAHHEKLDGKGYPRAVQAPSIPLQSRMMAVADIYDALTASDRPYKKALPHEKALSILEMEARSGQLDASLLQVFVEAGVPGRALSRQSGAGAAR
jgi:HD-GYP domain-containing protein (c-di-GMP phosphodiesterase class II)